MEMPPTPSDDAVRELAQDIVGNRVYFADHVPTNLLLMVFMPLAFGAMKGYTEGQLAQLALFAVDGRHQTAGRYINGYPMFMQLRVWPRESAIKACDLARRMRELAP